MAFVNLSLLIGTLAVGLPIVLHLVMRQQPKSVEFPAVMFLKIRKEANRRRLQLRHWLLLALRCLAVLLLALALARPSVASALVGHWVMVGVLGLLAMVAGVAALIAFWQQRGALIWGILTGIAGMLLVSSLATLAFTLSRDPGVNIGQAESPVAAVLLVDSAPRMQYRHANQTRLEKAKEIGAWLLSQLPKESDIAVLDTGATPGAFAIDRSSAGKTLAGLAPSSLSRPLPEVLPTALDLLETSEQNRKEIYILTDRTDAAWRAESNNLATRLESTENLSVYVIDVGITSPQNSALGEISLSKTILSRSGQLQIGTSVVRTGNATAATVELNVEQYDPTLPIVKDGQTQLPPPDPQRRRRQSVNLAADGSASVQFSLSGLELGTHHGTLTLDPDDALDIDNRRYFTFEVREPWPVLVAAGPGADASLLTEALAPYEFRATNQARFRCDEVTLTDLATRDLQAYAVVAVLDPSPLAAATWQQLATYTQQGGSVAIFLGHNARVRKTFNDPPAQELLPGKLQRQWKSIAQPRDYNGAADVYLTPNANEHEMLAAFREIAANVPWFDFPIFRHWGFEGESLPPGSRVVVRYSNNQPAMVIRNLGRGQVLTMTTPISDPARPTGRDAWNWLPTEQEPWPYVMLINETMLHLAGSGDAQLNYQTGQAATIAEPTGDDGRSYLLFTPLGGRPQTSRSEAGAIYVPFTETPGNYRLKSTETGELRGFSVNLPISASQLDRLESSQLDQTLGAENYKTARHPDEILREQDYQRVGQQFFPFLMFVLVVVLGLDALLANRFYQAQDNA